MSQSKENPNEKSEPAAALCNIDSPPGGGLFGDDHLTVNFLFYALNEHAIVSMADVKGRITYVNEKFINISGYSQDELIGQNHRTLKSSEHSDEFYKEMWRTIARGKPWSGEIKNLTKSGRPYWVLATIIPFLGDGYKPVQYLSIRTDITQAKATAALRQQQRSFDLIKDEVYMFWPDTLQFFYANKVAREHSGLEGEDISSLKSTYLAKNMDEAEFCERLSQLESGQIESVVYRQENSRRDGSSYPAEVTIQLVRPGDDAPRYFAVVGDITQRQESERAKSQFLATISHELRTPLHGVLGMAGLFETTDLDDEQKIYADTIISSGKELEGLIEDLLNFSKIEAGDVKITPSNFALDDLTSELEGYFSALASKKGLKLEIITDPDLPEYIYGDKNKIAQIVNNFISNAIKFTDVGGVQVNLTRTSRNGEKHLKITVSDTGIGISDEMKLRIFNSFQQVDMTSTRRFGGCGLGLAICRSLVEILDGEISMTSKLGVGSEFSVIVPIEH